MIAYLRFKKKPQTTPPKIEAGNIEAFNSPAGNRGELKITGVNLHLCFFLHSSNNYSPYE